MTSILDQLKRGPWGFYVLVGVFAVSLAAGQTLLIRETMGALYGSEFSFSLVLGGWLVGVSLGALLGGLAIRIARPGFFWLCGLGLWYSLALPGMIVFVRLIRSLWHIAPGEFVPLGVALVATSIAAVPLGLAGGFIFPVVCEILAVRQPDAARRVVAPVYISDAAGAFAGGCLLAFVLLPHFSSFRIIIVSITLFWVCVALVVWAVSDRHRLRKAILVGIFSAVWLMTGLRWWGPDLAKFSRDRLWRSQSTFTLVKTVNTPYQCLMLGRRQELYALYANGIAVSTFPKPYTNPIDAALYVSQHPRPRRVLWIGAGLGGPVQQLVDWGIERIHFVQLDPAMIALTVAHLPAADRAALASPRLRIFARDALYVVRAAAGKRELPTFALATGRNDGPPERLGDYDLVVLNIGDPASLLSNRLCTVEFYAQLARIMSPTGVVALGPLHGAEVYVEGPVRRYLGCHWRTLAAVFPDVLAKPGAATLLFAAKQPGELSSDPEVLRRRCRALTHIPEGVGEIVGFEFPPDRTRYLMRQLATTAGPLNHETRPAAVVSYLQLWSEITGGRGPGLRTHGGWFRRMTPLHFAGGFIALVGLVAVVARLLPSRAPTAAGGLCVLTSGFLAMTMATLILFLYQSRFGYVYAQVSLLIGSFMVGLCAGGWLAHRLLRRAPAPTETPLARHLLCIETGQIALVCLLAWLLTRTGVPAVVFFASQTAVGVLVGLVFPIANAISCPHGRRVGLHAAIIDAADHLGAVSGAFACGLILMPAVGLLGAVLTLTLCKALSGLHFASVALPKKRRF